MSGIVTLSHTFGPLTSPVNMSFLDDNYVNLTMAFANLNNFGNYLVDTGTANTYAVTLSGGTAAALAAGLPLQVKIGNNNTGACTLAIGGGPATSIKTLGGADPASGALVAGGISFLQYDGTNFQLLNPAVQTASNITLGTPAASTSGTAINFTGIPATARRVAVNFKGVSSSGSSNIQVQPGPVGGVETTGYLSRATEISSTGTSATSGFLLTSTGLTSSSVIHGSIILTLENASAFSWCAMGILNDSGNNVQYSSSGSKSFAAAMTQLTVTTVNGTDTFDAGEINIAYQT